MKAIKFVAYIFVFISQLGQAMEFVDKTHDVKDELSAEQKMLNHLQQSLDDSLIFIKQNIKEEVRKKISPTQKMMLLSLIQNYSELLTTCSNTSISLRTLVENRKRILLTWQKNLTTQPDMRCLLQSYAAFTECASKTNIQIAVFYAKMMDLEKSINNAIMSTGGFSITEAIWNFIIGSPAQNDTSHAFIKSDIIFLSQEPLTDLAMNTLKHLIEHNQVLDAKLHIAAQENSIRLFLDQLDSLDVLLSKNEKHYIENVVKVQIDLEGN